MKKIIICIVVITLLFGAVGCTLKGKDSSNETNEYTNEEKTTNEKSSEVNIPKITTEETTEKKLFNINPQEVPSINVRRHGNSEQITDERQIAEIVKDINNFTYNKIRTEEIVMDNTIPEGGGPVGIIVNIAGKGGVTMYSFFVPKSNDYIGIRQSTNYIYYYSENAIKINYDYFKKFIPELAND